MKITIRTIFLCLATTVGNSVCMENTLFLRDLYNVQSRQPTAIKLLDNDCQQLERLLNTETNGQFTPDLLVAEQSLIFFLTHYGANTLKNLYSEKTLELAIFVAERPEARHDLLTILTNNTQDNPIELETIITLNPYVLNAYDSTKKNILHQAVLSEKQHCIKTLLHLQANPNCLDGCGNSPLHIAIKKEQPIAIIEELLLAGANPDIRNQEGHTPFTLACNQHSPCLEAFEKYGYLFFSSLWPYKNVFELLNNNGVRLKELAKEPLGSNEWELAATALEKLFKQIECSKKSAPKMTTILTSTNGVALINACPESCDSEFGKKTMAYAHNLMIQKSKIKEALLSIAENNESKNLTKLLKKYNVSALLQYATIITCIENNSTKCLSLCLNHGFNPNRYHRQLSLLHYAIACNNPTAIKLLANHNADLTPRNKNDQTPLDYAISINDIKCIHAMVKAIHKRLISLDSPGKRCGLVQHILHEKAWPCIECIQALNWELQWTQEQSK